MIKNSPDRENGRPFTHEQSLEVCLEMVVRFAASDDQTDDSHAPWFRQAVYAMRVSRSRVFTTKDIERFQNMGTVDVITELVPTEEELKRNTLILGQ